MKKRSAPSDDYYYSRDFRCGNEWWCLPGHEQQQEKCRRVQITIYTYMWWNPCSRKLATMSREDARKLFQTNKIYKLNENLLPQEHFDLSHCYSMHVCFKYIIIIIHRVANCNFLQHQKNVTSKNWKCHYAVLSVPVLVVCCRHPNQNATVWKLMSFVCKWKSGEC